MTRSLKRPSPYRPPSGMPPEAQKKTVEAYENMLQALGAFDEPTPVTVSLAPIGFWRRLGRWFMGLFKRKQKRVS